jgi:hypothetical protein
MRKVYGFLLISEQSQLLCALANCHWAGGAMCGRRGGGRKQRSLGECKTCIEHVHVDALPSIFWKFSPPPDARCRLSLSALYNYPPVIAAALLSATSTIPEATMRTQSLFPIPSPEIINK